MASATPGISHDASSLRAAALLTLKTKTKPRTRVSAETGPPSHQHDDVSSVASTRRAAPSPELNYGSDDGMADAEGSTEEDEGGEKEEGEISDDETAVVTKRTHTMMDIDNEPLPGLTSSPDKLEESEATGFSDPKPQKPMPPPTYNQGYLDSKVSNKPTSTSAPTASSNSHSILPTKTSDLSSPNVPSVPRSVPGPRTLEHSAASKSGSSRARAPSVSTKYPEMPERHVTASSSSSNLHPRPSQHDNPRKIHVPDLHDDQVGVTKPPGSPLFTAVTPSRQSPPQQAQPPVDQAHARPSLKMTVQEFVEAKTIILDLLGWGVPPEYFINCGLTREAIYYAFSEMNLKLPTNLNADGIIPYGPPQGYTQVLQRPHEARHDLDQNHVLEPPKPAGDHTAIRDRQTSTTGRNAHMQGQVKLGILSNTAQHPLPAKPKSASSPPSSPSTYGGLKTHSVPQQTASQAGSGPSHNGNSGSNNKGIGSNQVSTSTSQIGTIPGLLHDQFAPRTSHPPSTTMKPLTSMQSALPVKPSSVAPSMPDTPAHGYSGNLDEIETLRRQELQARKAVLASRKPKAITSSSPAQPPVPENSRPKSPLPSASSTPSSKLSVPPETVDDFLKSIASGKNSVSNGDPAFQRPLTRSPDSMDMDIDTRSPEDEVPTSAETIPTLYEGSQPHATQHAYPPRKGSNKRPVASDFVDYDAYPHSRESPFSSSANYNGGASSNGRGKLVSTPSFSNLASSWKIVIDFSDTEDEDGIDVSKRSGSTNQHRSHSGINAPTPVMPTSVLRRLGSPSVPTPELKSPAPPSGASPITPSTLLAKEQEIKRMKELIAERELNRLKKLLHTPKGVTPPVSQPSATILNPADPFPASAEELIGADIAQSPPVKREETVDVPFISKVQPEASDSATPLSGDLLDEDAVMHDIFTRDASIADMSTTSTQPSTDDVADDSETTVPGEQVLTVEAGHEQVMDCEVTPANGEPQIQDLPFQNQRYPSWPSGETQAPPKQHNSRRFSAYASPLSSFAFSHLLTQLDSTIDFTSFTLNSSTFNSSIPPLAVDTPISQQVPALLRPLKEAALLKLDPKRSICQFEIPGAGKCRDQACQNVHLRAFEPNDDETARYLAKALPAPRPTVQEVKSAISRTRASSKQELDFDTRASQVLLQLGVR